VALGGQQVLRGIYRVAVAGVDARALDVLHDSGDEGRAAVRDRVDLDLLPTQVFVDKHASRTRFKRRPEIPLEVLRPVGDLHTASTEHTAWPDEHGVAELGRHRE